MLALLDRIVGSEEHPAGIAAEYTGIVVVAAAAVARLDLGPVALRKDVHRGTRRPAGGARREGGNPEKA